MLQFLFGERQIVQLVVSAFVFAGSRNLVNFQAIFKRFDRCFFCLIFGYALKKQIEPRAAAHRPEVNHLFLYRAVPDNRRKQVFDGVHCGHVEIVAFIRPFEAQVVSEDTVFLTGQVKFRPVNAVIDGERMNF